MRLVQVVWTAEQNTKLTTNPSKTKQMQKNELLEVASELEMTCTRKVTRALVTLDA